MARRRDDEERTEVEEEELHNRTMRRFEHLDVNNRMEEMEALERGFRRASRGGVKKSRQNLLKDLHAKHDKDNRREVSSDDVRDLLRRTGGQGATVDDFEGNPTGIDEAAGNMPWDQDDEEDY